MITFLKLLFVIWSLEATRADDHNCNKKKRNDYYTTTNRRKDKRKKERKTSRFSIVGIDK